MRLRDSLSYVFSSIASVFLISMLFNITITFAQFLQIITVMTLFSLYSFCSNNLFDKEIDKVNPIKKNKNPYSSGEISKKGIILINAFLLISMFLLTYLWFPNTLLFLFLFTVNVTLYSRYFKRLPIIDLVSHFIWIFSFFLFPALIMGLPLNIIPIFAIAFLGISNHNELDGNQLPDLESDRKAGIRSTSVFFGKRVARIISYASIFLFIVAIICVILITNFSIIRNYSFMLIAPLFGLSLVREIKPDFLGSNYGKVYLAYFIFFIMFSSATLFY